MSVSNKKDAILISVMSIIILIISTVLYYQLKPKHHAIPVYKRVSEDVYKPYFHVGETRFFTKGALYCENLDDIKQYYDHMNARNRPRVILLIVLGGCNYSSEDKVYAVLEEVTGMFVKVTPQDIDDAAPRWMPALELNRE
ncbi:MAG: hypothetical protein OQL16_10890 [Gammaproteobacteria bacterium]|nr:hypothetical protein [Gammaproteobacteria bacterium]